MELAAVPRGSFCLLGACGDGDVVNRSSLTCEPRPPVGRSLMPTDGRDVRKGRTTMVQERVVQLTAGGKAKLEEELRLLRDERKPSLTARIYEANEHGDVTDNGEFEELKEELIVTEARIANLEQLLTRAEIIETGRSDGTVQLGSRVKLSSDDGEEETWLLVSPEEANSMGGSISTESPVGRALIGCHEGDSATVITPAGSIVYTVLTVE